MLTIAASLAWWLPAILLALARLMAGRVRFHAAIGLGRALAGVGCTAAACRIYRHEQARAGRRMAAIRARRGW